MNTQTYIDENNNLTTDRTKAKFLKIESYDDETGDIRRSWTIKLNNVIQKAKVYIKNPNQAPKGAKIERGQRGGLYYENTTKPKMSLEDLENLHDDNPEDDGFREKEPEKLPEQQLIIWNEVDEGFLKDLNEGLDGISDSQLPQKEYIENITTTANINKRFKVIWLPLTCEVSYAYNDTKDTNKIYMFSTSNEELNNYVNSCKMIFDAVGYDTRNMTIDNKRVAILIHEEGHLMMGLKDFTTDLIEIPRTVERFKEYCNYINQDIEWESQDNFYRLLEYIAEDWRQIKGGEQTVFPHKYFFKSDIMFPENKEERLKILKNILKV